MLVTSSLLLHHFFAFSITRSDSMLSVVPLLSLVIVRRSSFNSLHPNQLVSFRVNSVDYVHETFKRLSPTSWTTHAAISPKLADAWTLTPRELVGHVVVVVPYVGVLASPYAALALAALAAGIVLRHQIYGKALLVGGALGLLAIIANAVKPANWVQVYAVAPGQKGKLEHVWFWNEGAFSRFLTIGKERLTLPPGAITKLSLPAQQHTAYLFHLSSTPAFVCVGIITLTIFALLSVIFSNPKGELV